MEYSEDRVLDADIYVNYHTKEIKFENKVKRGNPIVSTVKLMLIFFCLFGLTILCSVHTTPFPRTTYDFNTGTPTIYQTPWDYYYPSIVPVVAVIFFGTLFVEFLELWWSGSNPFLRDRMLGVKRSGYNALVEIPNPSGTITYRFTGNGAPLVDMEYSDDIADALVESSLVREKEQKTYLKHFKHTRSYMILKVVLSRPANGILKITEY